MSTVYAEIYEIVQKIPRGRVLTYGLVSHLIGGKMSAQGVGWALKALGSTKKETGKSTAPKTGTGKRKTTKSVKNQSVYNSTTVPWQRVVNSKGSTSTHKIAEIPPGLQQHLLELEGIVFNDEGQMELDNYLWKEGLNGLGTYTDNGSSPVRTRKRSNLTFVDSE